MRMPDRANAHLVVALDLSKDFAALPVPKPQPAVGVARHDVVAVRRDSWLARVARDDVAFKRLLAVELEAVGRRVGGDLVVQILAEKPLVIGRLGDGGHRMQRWIWPRG